MLISLLTMLALAAPPEEPADIPAFQDVCFDNFEEQNGFPSHEQLKRLLGEVPGYDYKLNPRQALQERIACAITGVFRVQQPWQAGTAMQLSILTYNTLRLHFWRGNQGMTMMSYRGPYEQWAAYGTTRKGNKPQPETYALWGTDEGRYQQSGAAGTVAAAAVTVLYQDGYLYLTRGDVVLLAVPFAEPPTEVFLEANGMVRELRFFQCKGTPAATKPPPVVSRIDKPAEATWDVRPAAGITLNKLPDGAVELTAKEKTPVGQAAVAACSPGLHAFVFEIQDADVGTGIYFGDSAGKPLQWLGWIRAQATQSMLLWFQAPGGGLSEQWVDVNFNSAIPYAGKRQWVRMVPGSGVWKCAMSGDGIHWGQAAVLPCAQRRPPCTQVGLYCIASDKLRSIKLRSIQVQRLDGLWSLAPAAVHQRVPEQVGGSKALPAAAPGSAEPPLARLAQVGSVEQWLQVVDASRPGDVASEVWQRACALQTLAHSPAPQIYQALLLRLLDDLPAGPWELDAKLRALDEAAMLMNTADKTNAGQLAERYAKLGQALVRQGHPAPYTAVQGGFLRAPIQTYAMSYVPWDDLLTAELFPLLYQDRWREVDQLCRRIRFWQSPRRIMNTLPADEAPVAELSDWARTLVPRATATPRGERGARGGRWRPLLIPPLSREGYNAVAELEGSIQGRAYREACQVITSTPNLLSLGVVSDAIDKRLMVSYPVAIQLGMGRAPELRTAMEESFLQIGRLRLQEAIRGGDEYAVETVAAQFYGTAAAVEARQWLGDHALSAGRFAYSIGQYKQALAGATAGERAALAARARLAAALLGREMASPPKKTVEIGEAQYSPEQFEQLVTELRQAHGEADFAPYFAGRASSCPPPGRCEARAWSRFDGGDVPLPNAPGLDFDWGARQLAVAFGAGQMLLSDRSSVVAYNLADARILWQQKLQADKTVLQQAWPLVSLRPAASRSRVFVRRLLKEGPDLASLDTADGRVVWNSNPDGTVVSDPLLSGEELFALTVRNTSPQELLLSLTQLNPATGEVLKQTPLSEFVDAWQGVLPCQAIAVDGKIVATVGGCVLCCEQSGRLQWLRQQVWIPPRGEPTVARPWFAQPHDLPLVEGDRVYAMQPGMRSVECLELATGKLLWQQTIPRLSRMHGLVGERLVVSTTSELLGLEAAAGKIVWRCDAPDRIEAYLCARPGSVLYLHFERPTDPKAAHRPVLTWLDPETGRPLGESVVAGLPNAKAMFGPLVSHGNRQWLFFTTPPNLATREIWEVAPAP